MNVQMNQDIRWSLLKARVIEMLEVVTDDVAQDAYSIVLDGMAQLENTRVVIIYQDTDSMLAQ